MNGVGRRLVFLAAVTMIATSMLGATYTIWYEDLIAAGAAETGSVEAAWESNATCANVTGDFSATSTSDDPRRLLVSIVQGLYGERIDCTARIVNTGTVAVHVEQIKLTVTDTAGTVYELTCDENGCGGAVHALIVNLDGVLGCDIGPGATHDVSLQLGLVPSDQEGDFYHVQAVLTLNQWNVSQWEDCGIPGPPAAGETAS
jgi:hypothetical protein